MCNESRLKKRKGGGKDKNNKLMCRLNNGSHVEFGKFQ